MPESAARSSAAPLLQRSLFTSELQPLAASPRIGGIEEGFDIPLVAGLALREKQVQQNYRPVIAVHKWFARRPGTLFRALLLAEFSDQPLAEGFFSSHDLSGLRVADPFMGGGTPLLEANRLGCDVTGWDINPMAYWIVRQEIEHLDLAAYKSAAQKVASCLDHELAHFYQTRCERCGMDAQVKYFLWVKTLSCEGCGHGVDLFPGYLLAEAGRHPKNVLVCPACNALQEVDDREAPGNCGECSRELTVHGPARRGRCACACCGSVNPYPGKTGSPLAHRLFAIEYHCHACRPHHAGRFFKRPAGEDLARYERATETWSKLEPRFAPSDLIPAGDETDRLHRWGYSRYRDMFNDRQLLGLETICRQIAQCDDVRVRGALATNLSDLLRYQNLLCRYDTMALKSLDIFSVHGFPVGLVQCESNLLGFQNSRTGANVGSGGWSNIVDKFIRAKEYCEQPFEVQYRKGRKVIVPIVGEWIGDQRDGGQPARGRQVDLRCESATGADLPPASLDAVLTDPPYFANVQYAELMDFCYVWLRRLVGQSDAAFTAPSTRSPDELTGNVTMDRGLDHFAAGLSEVFRRMAAALKSGSPLAFTYHHNRLEAYFPVAVAILDAGLVCTASLPCPAEMGGSIHIHGTASSIVDSVFVCRTTGTVKRRLLVRYPEEIAGLVAEDLTKLAEGGVRLTIGDARCVAYGHLIRLAVWKLKGQWTPSASWAERLAAVAGAVASFGGLDAIEGFLDADGKRMRFHLACVREAVSDDEQVSF